MYTVVQFSSIYYNILSCNSRGKRITFFSLIQIHSDLLLQCFYEKDKSDTLPFTAGLQISQGNENLPFKATLAAPNSLTPVSNAEACYPANEPPRPQEDKLEHSRSCTAAEPSSPAQVST